MQKSGNGLGTYLIELGRVTMMRHNSIVKVQMDGPIKERSQQVF